ncbi:unnamed protein product, partial [Closterium sp. NIES-54]
PPATADGATHSQWLSRDATACLAIRNHLPVAECTHFGQHKTAQALYDVVVARYSSPATAALGRLLLLYLFPELSAFATVADLPPMFITLYFIVSHLPDSLRSVRDHFLSLVPTSLTIDLLEQHLLAAKTSAVAVGAALNTPRPPFFEGCSPSPLSPSYASTAAADVSVTEDVGAASTSVKRSSSKGKGDRSGGDDSGGGGGGSGSGRGSSGGGGGGSGGGGGGGTGGGGGGSGGSGGSGGGGSGGGRSGPWRGGPGGGQCQQEQRRSETQSPQQLREWLVQRGTGGGSDSCPSGVAIFDLDYDAIISAMYALSFSAEGDCYRCVPPDPGIAAAALGASACCNPPGTAPTEALHTFTLDSDASRCFFRDSTTLTPLLAPVLVRLADPSRGPVVARSSTVLPCPAVPSGSLSGLHLPSFSTNLVSTAALQDTMVTTTTLGGQRVSICTCTRTGRHLALFTRRPGSSLYTLTTEPPQVVASAQVSASGQVADSCSCHLLSHQTLLWHHRVGHLSLPRLRGMHSRFLVSSLPRTLPPLPPLPAPPCLPCVEGRQRAAPHSSSFPLTTAPLQTLHIDVKGEVVDVLIPWIRTVRLQLYERFGTDLPVLRLHSDRGGEFSSDLLRDFCRGEGILQPFRLLDSPQQNGIAERSIGLVMEVARTSMIHAAAPHFLWPFAARYAAHRLNLWPRVSLPETSPTLRWTGKVGDASVFRFNHPTSRRVLASQDVMFDKSVPFYCLFPYRSAPTPPPPLFLAPGPPPVDPLPPHGPAPSGVSHVDPLPGTVPVEVAVGSGAARGAVFEGAISGGAEPGGAGSEGAGSGGTEPGGAKPEGVEPRGADSEGAEPGGAEPRGAALSGAPGAGGAGETRARGAAVPAGAGDTGGAAATGPGGARTSGAGAAGTGGVGCAGAGDPTEPGQLALEALELEDLELEALALEALDLQELELLTLALEVLQALCGRDRPSFPCFSRQPPHCLLPLPTLSSPAVLQSVAMALHPSSVPQRVPLPAPPESSLPEVPNHASDRARAASPTVSRLLAIAVTDPSFESAAASPLVAELLDFAAAFHLDYATALVAESASTGPPSVGGECALGADVLEDRQKDFECLAAAVPRFASMLLAHEGDPDAPDIPTPRSYAEVIEGPYSSQW